MDTTVRKQFRYALLMIFLIILSGTFSFVLLEGWSIIDSFYMTIITISTTGFKEVRPLSPAGRIITIILIVSGVTIIAYIGGRFFQLLIETQLLRRRRMSKMIDQIKNHYIVCGYGRMGRQICEALRDAKKSFVVIENDENKIERIIEEEFLYVAGDASDDDILIQAGIKRAKGIVAVVRTDAENVFITLSAKELNKEVYIVARAVEEASEGKLKKAGADKVVMPYELGGTRMVQLLLRPGVTDFVDVVYRKQGVDIAMEEILVTESSSLIGMTLMQAPIRKELNVIIVGIVRNDGKLLYNPGSATILEKGDKLISIGEKTSLEKLTELCLK